MEKKPKLTGKKKLAVVGFIAAVVLCIVAMAAYSLFFKGYYLGLRTMTAEKTDVMQTLCLHTWNSSDGICVKCGLKCAHPKYDEQDNCMVCGYHHVHEFEECVCKTCGYECQHEEWLQGYCKACGKKCEHLEWEENACVVCGLHCAHRKYSDGHCVDCGYECPHETWKNGACVVCGQTCKHEEHDSETQACLVCGTKVKHSFIKGVCACGAYPEFAASKLNDSMLAECRKKGSVNTVSYTTKKYSGDNSSVQKNMDVYTPYGYSDENQYNVLLLMHGNNGHYYDWTTNPITVGSMMCAPRNVYDNMIDRGLCEPLIIVSVTTLCDTENGEAESGSVQMSEEICQDILPYIIEHYSTYAEGTTIDDITKVREHFGIGGIDNGATYAYSCGIEKNFDIFGNFVCLSGCAEPIEYVTALNSKDNMQYPIECLYIGAGGNDAQRVSCYNGFDIISSDVERAEVNSNIFYGEIAGAGHNWDAWSALICNALLVLFH